jgi:hypothetical protein
MPKHNNISRAYIYEFSHFVIENVTETTPMRWASISKQELQEGKLNRPNSTEYNTIIKQKLNYELFLQQKRV